MSTRMRRGNPYYQQPLFDKYGRYEIDHSAYQEKVRGMSDAALRYTIEDARKALRAMPEGRKAGYYQDEINYASDELARRRSGGRARNPYGYMIAGRTRPHAWSSTQGFPYRDRREAKRLIGERVRAMGRRGDDVAFDAYLTEPKGRKIRKTRIRVPGYARNPSKYNDKLINELDQLIEKYADPNLKGFAARIPESKFFRSPPRGLSLDRPTDSEIRSKIFFAKKTHEKASRNPDVRLHWTAQYGHKYDPRQQRSVPDLRQRVAWWRTGLKKPKDVRRAVAKAHKYARKQKDWLSHRVTVEKNPRRRNRKSVKRKLASRWAKRRPRNAKGRFVKIKKRGSRRR